MLRAVLLTGLLGTTAVNLSKVATAYPAAGLGLGAEVIGIVAPDRR